MTMMQVEPYEQRNNNNVNTTVVILFERRRVTLKMRERTDEREGENERENTGSCHFFSLHSLSPTISLHILSLSLSLLLRISLHNSHTPNTTSSSPHSIAILIFYSLTNNELQIK